MNARLAAIAAHFDRLAPREKRLVGAGCAVVALALLWWIALAPAWRVVRGAEAQHRTLDAKLQRMLRLQAQAQALQTQPKQSQDEALRQLEQTIRQQLGTNARYVIAGDRVTVTLSGATSESLAQWLTQARVNARSLPADAKLQRNPAGTWDGTVALVLPPP